MDRVQTRTDAPDMKIDDTHTCMCETLAIMARYHGKICRNTEILPVTYLPSEWYLGWVEHTSKRAKRPNWVFWELQNRTKYQASSKECSSKSHFLRVNSSEQSTYLCYYRQDGSLLLQWTINKILCLWPDGEGRDNRWFGRDQSVVNKCMVLHPGRCVGSIVDDFRVVQ